MRNQKIRLDLERLEADTFEVLPAAEVRGGTVNAHDSTTVMPQRTCWNTCGCPTYIPHPCASPTCPA